MIQIVPAILDKTQEEFEKHVGELNNSFNLKDGWVHIDFADNEFVSNKTINVEVVRQNPINLKKEAHLMVLYPLDWIDGLKQAGFKRVIFHYESSDEKLKVIEAIRESGMEAGIAINPETSIDSLEIYKDKIQQILVMGIVPGFQGQPFIPATIERIKDLKSKDWPVKISVDGAVTGANARELVEAGVDQLVSGSFLLKGDIDENVEKIWEVIQGWQKM